MGESGGSAWRKKTPENENVINTATDIKYSPIHHQNNKCLEFTQDIDGNIIFVVEVRIKFGGWLALVTCYRRKKSTNIAAERTGY
jgi:hypothetical protein